MGLHDAVLENLPHATTLMTMGMTAEKTFLRAHEDSIKCLQVHNSYTYAEAYADLFS